MMAILSEDDVATAAEFALGLLDSSGEASTSARVATDTDFAAEVEAWRERMLPLVLGGEEPVPAHVWQSIATKIAMPAVQDNDQSRVRLWQGISFFSTAAAAVLAAVMFFQPAPPIEQPTAPMVAALGSETSNAALTASYDSKNGQMLLTPVSLDTGNLYPELWVIPADGKARSLGIVSGVNATQMLVPKQLREFLNQGATLAITPEPAGGAPGGKATGPVLASGKIISV